MMKASHLKLQVLHLMHSHCKSRENRKATSASSKAHIQVSTWFGNVNPWMPNQAGYINVVVWAELQRSFWGTCLTWCFGHACCWDADVHLREWVSILLHSQSQWDTKAYPRRKQPMALVIMSLPITRDFGWILSGHWRSEPGHGSYLCLCINLHYTNKRNK